MTWDPQDPDHARAVWRLLRWLLVPRFEWNVITMRGAKAVQFFRPTVSRGLDDAGPVYERAEIVTLPVFAVEFPHRFGRIRMRAAWDAVDRRVIVVDYFDTVHVGGWWRPHPSMENDRDRLLIAASRWTP